MSADLVEQIENLIAGEKRALGRAISLCEDARPSAVAGRAELIAALAAHPGRRRARMVGLTGPPGAGKSTLIGELAPRLLAAQPTWAVCVLAIDPSSAITGGAVLGDRVRVKFPPGEPRLFFRSQASDLEVGGLGRHTFAVCRLLQHLFDCVLVETVGVGQSEVEVHHLVDRTYLVLPPHAGDSIQLMKAGIMEIPDAVILAKQDLPGAGEGAGAIEAELARRRGAGGGGAGSLPLHRVSARTGSGVDGVAAELAGMPQPPGSAAPLDAREPRFFQRWVESELGRRGLAVLEARGGAGAVLREAGGFDGAVAAFPALAHAD